MTWFKSLIRNHKKIIILLLALVVGGGVWRFRSSSQTRPEYQTAQAEKGTLVSSVSASGNVTAGNSLPITTTATGIVSAVYVKNGDTVSQGQKIADVALDQSSRQRQAAAWSSYLAAQNTLRSGEANLNSLQSTMFKANQTFLTDKGIANPSDAQKADPKYVEENADWLAAEANYKNQQNVIAQAQAAVNSSWLSWEQASSIIIAPTAGLVKNLIIAPGTVISSSSNTSGTNSTTSIQTLGTVTNTGSSPQAVVNIAEIDAPKVSPGQKVTLTLDAFPDKTFTGQVLLVNTNGVVSSGVTSYPATIAFDSAPANLYSNMAVTAKIITSVKNDVILVPTAAVQTLQDQSTVRVLKNGQVETVSVEVGDASDTQTEIISGLSAGDTVVTGTTTTQRTGTTNTSLFGGFGGSQRVFFRGG